MPMLQSPPPGREGMMMEKASTERSTDTKGQRKAFFSDEGLPRDDEGRFGTQHSGMTKATVESQPSMVTKKTTGKSSLGESSQSRGFISSRATSKFSKSSLKKKKSFGSETPVTLRDRAMWLAALGCASASASYFAAN